jgi:Flp pilus assembly secretin CpaC
MSLAFLSPLSRAASLALGGLLLAATSALANPVINVELDRAQLVKLAPGAVTLVVGNPVVADITLLKTNGTVVVTGRSFGTTNLIALDAQGEKIDEAMIKVTHNTNVVTVMRGTLQQSYACNPRCAPTVTLGDDNKYMDESIAAIKNRNAISLSGGK